MKEVRDAELFIDGLIALSVRKATWQCRSVIVANDGPVRWYHNCCDEADHDGPHECGCDQKWWFADETWNSEGPLSRVAFGADFECTDFPPNGELFGASAAAAQPR